MKIRDFTLSNGVDIPGIGFGTWQIPEGKDTYDAVSFAIKSGYRHIDTALAYGNEFSVGKAVRDSGLERSEVFVTSKLPSHIKNFERALEAFGTTIKNTGFDYIDLYLIHAPWPWGMKGTDFTAENIKVWRALEEIYLSGKCRSIGISNFNIRDVNAILGNCRIIPMVNQIKYYIGRTDDDLVKFCRMNNIVVEGYSPLATGRILKDDALAMIAEKYRVTVPRICIRYVLQKDLIPLPKSVHPEYIAENFEIGFEISAADMEYLDSLKFSGLRV